MNNYVPLKTIKFIKELKNEEMLFSICELKREIELNGDGNVNHFNQIYMVLKIMEFTNLIKYIPSCEKYKFVGYNSNEFITFLQTLLTSNITTYIITECEDITYNRDHFNPFQNNYNISLVGWLNLASKQLLFDLITNKYLIIGNEKNLYKDIGFVLEGLGLIRILNNDNFKIYQWIGWYNNNDNDNNNNSNSNNNNNINNTVNDYANNNEDIKQPLNSIFGELSL